MNSDSFARYKYCQRLFDDLKRIAPQVDETFLHRVSVDFYRQFRGIDVERYEPRGLGAYAWVALLRDGTSINQYDEQGQEVSIDSVRGLDVTQILLLPMSPGFPPIRMDVDNQTTQAWVKKWTRDQKWTENPEGEPIKLGIRTTDVLELTPKPGCSVKLFMYDDGSFRFTTDNEP